jgi:hypothetical protein
MRILQTAEIILPPNFVQVSNFLTVYYVFNASSTNSINSTDNSANVAAGTDQTATTTIPDTTIPTTATDNSTIDFYLVFLGSSNHWLGLGFGTSMAGSDMIIVEIVNGVIVVTDRYSPDHFEPELDTNQDGNSDLTLVDSTMNETTMVVHIRRLQNTTDPLDCVFTGPGTYSWIWAYNPQMAISYHGDGGSNGITSVTLVDTTVPVEDATADAETTTSTPLDSTGPLANSGDSIGDTANTDTGVSGISGGV